MHCLDRVPTTCGVAVLVPCVGHPFLETFLTLLDDCVSRQHELMVSSFSTVGKNRKERFEPVLARLRHGFFVVAAPT